MNKMYSEIFPYETRILLVEDTEITRKILHKMLYKLGYCHVTEAENGTKAMEFYERAVRNGKPFQLVISDWKMPGLSGVDLLKRVRSDKRSTTVPFIILTTNNRKEHVVEAAKSGVDNYLAKPFVIEVLDKKLRATWSRVRKRMVA